MEIGEGDGPRADKARRGGGGESGEDVSVARTWSEIFDVI